MEVIINMCGKLSSDVFSNPSTGNWAVPQNYLYRVNMFKPTYLYVKTHNVTGLQYFGKTTQDPFKYKGSGLHWQRHLNVHGNDVTTVVIGFFEDQTLCSDVAIEFSKANQIVESSLWANMKIENGVDGGQDPGEFNPNFGKKQTPEHISNRMDLRDKLYYSTPEFKAKISFAHIGKVITTEQRRKISASSRGHKKTSNCGYIGKNNHRFGKSVSDETKTKFRESMSMKAVGCIHCRKILTPSNFSRWHGDNCKARSI